MTRRHHPGCHQPNDIRRIVTNYAVALTITFIHRQVQQTLDVATRDTRLNPRARIIGCATAQTVCRQPIVAKARF
jgi:hypothetical protein